MIYRDPLLKAKHFVKVKFRWSGRRLNDIIDLRICRKDACAVYYAGFGRQALLKGLSLLNVRQGDNVLVPAYICNTAIEPFYEKGINLKYYRIKTDFSVDADSLKNAIDKNTKALLYVNYFGLMDGFKDFENFCRKNNLYIIEDNAHFLTSDFSRIKGDISIFSLRKFYPVPNGALLVIKDNQKFDIRRIMCERVEKKTHLADYKFMTQALCRGVYRYFSNRVTNKILLKVKKNKDAFASQRINMPDILLPENISELSSYVIDHTDSRDIIIKRRNNYNFLLERLLSLNDRYVKVIFRKLNEDMCPLAFPVIVEKCRDDFIDNLFLNGYIAYPWQDMPRDVIKNNEYGNERFLNNSLVLLPIHQDLNERTLRKMVYVIKNWVIKIDKKN